MKKAFLKIRNSYVRFVEKQGFPIIVTLCIAIITTTALWRTQHDVPPVSPTPPVIENVLAAQLMQQSLRSAATGTPAPTSTPQRWISPVPQAEVLCAFSAEQMIQGSSGLWAIHDAVDLKIASGEQIFAMSDGIVTASGNDQLQGAWIDIKHGDKITAHYAGMHMLGSYIPGDDVRLGEVIGYAGNTMANERSLGPHLHLRVIENGVAIDPIPLWENVN